MGVTFQNDRGSRYCIHMISPRVSAYNGEMELRTRLLTSLYRFTTKYVIMTSYYLTLLVQDATEWCRPS